LNLFPETPAIAVGSMPLFLASVDKKTYDASPAQKAWRSSNTLVVDLKRFPANAWRFFVKDDSGNYLKQILSVTSRVRKARRCSACITSMAVQRRWRPISELNSIPCNTGLRSSSTRRSCPTRRRDCA
jgi:hypothetical protein